MFFRQYLLFSVNLRQMTKTENQRPKNKGKIVWILLAIAVVFVYFFALGSILAGMGWVAEIKALPMKMMWAMLAGHALQVVGAFGLLLIPDGEEENDSNTR